jgi:drug/metabolite transporter (DMT)-like permease
MAFTEEQWYGNVAAVLASVLFAVYIVASQQARQFYSTLDFSLYLYPIASACFLGYIWLYHLPLWPETPKAWFAIAGLTVFSTMLGHSLFAYLLKHLNINFMSFGKLIEPVLSSIVAMFIFGEGLGLHHLIAFICVAAGVGVYIRDSK